MPMTLPVLDDRPLGRSPLAVVVFQVRFEQNLSVGAGDTGLRVHDQLGGPDGRYVRVEPVQIMSSAVQVGPLGLSQVPSSNMPSRGFRMSNEDGTLILSLMPDFVSIDNTAYGAWKDDFRVRVGELLEAVAEHVNPRVEERVGLRYVNRILEPEISVPADFRGIIADGLLGATADEFWSPGVTGSQQQLEIDVSDGIRCVLRHGTLPRSTGIGLDGYLLDIDVFRAQPRRFNVKAIIETCDKLNEAATAIFQGSLTASYLDRLREAEKT
jgi:uncharacterized protein (TIGR04255 family)